MKSQTKQTGSVHLVIIGVLAIAVVGALGFIFWQNFIHTSATNKDANTVTTQSNPSSSDIKSDTSTQKNAIAASNSSNGAPSSATSGSSKTLSVNEWGVKGSYTSDETIGYTMNQYGNVTVTDSSIAGTCDSLGTISRGMATEKAIIGSTSSDKTNQQAYDTGYGFARAHVGNYYYFYSSPQASCQKSADIQDKAVKAAEDFVTALTSS